MLEQRFSWSSEKADANRRKHGIRFTDAVYVLGDAHRTERLDSRFDYDDERWVTTGLGHGRVLGVVYAADTAEEDTTRLISARKAKRDEQERYYRARNGRS